ncbi:ADP-ribose pyrophosphatase [Aureimonas sp. Leaf460]|nr:ADP-ribose pyrophosphatase [Aureimonas sp. Leaf427]KQT62282.1 ADP-ribose pyrophosphatase [Aureimonas sp. Leaf460]
MQHGSRPIAATIAVVIRGAQVLLVRRANPPDVGLWGFPGGKIDLGETIEAAAVRELREETGITGEFVRVLTAVDAFDINGDGHLRQHFILIAVVCHWVSGEPVAGDDASDARWFDLDELNNAALVMSFGVVDVARQAARL